MLQRGNKWPRQGHKTDRMDQNTDNDQENVHGNLSNLYRSGNCYISNTVTDPVFS